MRGRRQQLRCRPTIADQFKAFGVVDAILERLKDGWIHAIKGNPVFFEHTEEQWFDVPAAMGGWIALWERLSERYSLGIDFDPLTKLCRKLESGMPVTPEEVETCARIVKACKPHYRRMDVYVIGELVKTQKIANAMEEMGITKEKRAA